MQGINKNTFLQSFNKNTRLDKEFYLRIYGYEISYPGFSKIALDKLKEIGFPHAEEEYKRIVDTYEEEHSKQLKDVAKWLVEKTDRDFHKRKVM